MFKMIHVNGLITAAQNAAPPATRYNLTVIPGLDPSQIEKICSYNTDLETLSYPPPFNVIYINEGTRVLHLLNGLRRDPDNRYAASTTQFAVSADTSLRNLVNMLELYGRSYEFKLKHKAKAKAKAARQATITEAEIVEEKEELQSE